MKLIVAILFAFMAQGAAAQAWPSKPVRIVVPFPPGGTADLLSRLTAEKLGASFGQQFIVENRAGAGGNLAAEFVARAEPDGHTLLLSPPGPIAMNKLLYKSMPFDSSKWVPISEVASVPYVLAVRNGLASDVKGLVTKAKASPGKITYASPGAGTVGHLAAKQFEMLAGIELVTVPYKGLAPALKDIVGGHVDLIFDTATTSLPLHSGKQVEIIATGGSERSPAIPNVPTMAESGLPGFRAVTWYAVVAPDGTPQALADKISKDLVEVAKDPAVAEAIRTKLQMDPIGMSNADAAKLFVDDAKLWAKVIQEAKVSLD